MNHFRDIFPPQEWNSPDPSRMRESPVPGHIESYNSPNGSLSQIPRIPISGKQYQSQSELVVLLQLADWDQERTYDEDPPSCLHYSIEWKVTLNGKMISNDTERDLVLASASYWQLFLQPKLEKPLLKNFSYNRCEI
jgi:hypothetical protein